MMSKSTKTALLICVAALVGIAGLALVTRYQMQEHPGGRTIRLDRWTGHSWLLTLDDTPFWQPVEEVDWREWAQFLEWKRTNLVATSSQSVTTR